MRSSTKKHLVDATYEFFDRHWPSTLCDKKPSWSEPWGLKGPMCNHYKQGVYALLDSKENVIYIGVGASFSGGACEGGGLGARTSRYARVANGHLSVPTVDLQYSPNGEWRDRGIAAIAKIGFDIVERVEQGPKLLAPVLDCASS